MLVSKEKIMALRDLFGFLDDKLEMAFNTKPRDAVKARKPLLAGLDATYDHYESGRLRVTNKWWTASNGVVAFSPKVHKTPLIMNGKTTNFIPADRFTEFLTVMKAEVEAGELDAMIEAIENGTGNAGSSVAVPTAAPRTRAPMSDQAKANMREGRARAKAAREAAKSP
jgi:hypothetical protein